MYIRLDVPATLKIGQRIRMRVNHRDAFVTLLSDGWVRIVWVNKGEEFVGPIIAATTQDGKTGLCVYHPTLGLPVPAKPARKIS